MFPILFCAAVILLAIFNNVEAGCCNPSRHAVDEGQIHREPRLVSVTNMGDLAAVNGNVCPGVGIKTSPDDDFVRVVTTAHCALIILAVNPGNRRAKFGHEEFAIQQENVVVHSPYTAATPLPHRDIAVVLFPRQEFTNRVSTDHWPEIPEGNVVLGAGYRRAVSSRDSSTGEYKQRIQRVDVVSNDDCRSAQQVGNEHSDGQHGGGQHSGGQHGGQHNGGQEDGASDAFLCVQYLTTAASGTPVYMCDQEGNPTPIGLHQSTITGGYHQAISISHFRDWIVEQRPLE